MDGAHEHRDGASSTTEQVTDPDMPRTMETTIASTSKTSHLHLSWPRACGF